MGRTQPRLFLRLADPRPRRERRLKPPRLGVDAAVVPGLLLLLARDLALHDPPRVLAWRLTHDARLESFAAWLGPLLPAASGALDRDPIALLLSALAALLALAYAALAVTGSRPRLRAGTILLAAAGLVILPSIAFIAMGAATGRPYGQDGGVVQLPLAIDKILAGESPYGADYSGTILARQAQASSFWDEHGGNPILRHHAYLPGTHLVMLPFQLACRAAFGFFDPRLVTLLGYGLTIFFASRIPRAADSRLSAAGVAALNPLVYWHQIFGANDLLLVAMLLGAVLLLRAQRAIAAAALIGLACATKQLAWPFAPFLLLHLSSAGRFRDLVAPATWRRLAGPLAVSALVLVAVVAPVAALDLRAFWGDIVVYNAGLPGADNYPLGGTPGFGFANFVVYAGGVGSLRDYVPLSLGYLVLIPFGVLLLRAQLRAGEAADALLTGSAALLASLYLSRVVHANYLIPVAVLLPLPLLARRRRADLAVGPLLLLALATEIAESEPFRAVWEQASAAGLARRLHGLAATLSPHAGPQLSKDPLGLVFSALAAGFAVLYLGIGVSTARLETPSREPRPQPATGERALSFLRGLAWREPLLLVAALLVAAAPACILVRVGDATGLVRAQDAAPVQARADAARLSALRSPYSPPPETRPRGREAFSSSFRLDPPAEIEPTRPLLPPGAALVGALLRGLGQNDLRMAGFCAILALALLIAVILGERARPAVLAVALVSPPLALGTALGSPAVLWLAALVAAWAAARAGREVLAGVFVGLAASLSSLALLPALCLLLVPKAAAPAGWKRAVAAVATLAAVAGPVALLDVRAFLARLGESTPPGPGLGLFNLLAYRGVEAAAPALVFAAVAPAIGVLLAVLLVRLPAPPLARAGLASLIAIILAPAVSPEAVAAPLVLLALAVAVGEVGAEGGTGR